MATTTEPAVATARPRDPLRSARFGLFAVVAGAAIFLGITARGLWFGGDDWFIITDRGLTSGPGRQGLLEPHFEHWSSFPILIWRGLYSTFGLRAYWPYLGLTIVVHLVIVVLLWYVMTRAAVDGWVATCACAVFAAAGTGFENLVNAWQTQLILPLALGLGAILVAPESGRRFTGRDAIAGALLAVAVMSSGVALPMLLAVGLVLVVRRTLRVAALTLVVPVVAYSWWYLAFGRDGRNVADPAPDAIPRFVWHGITDALGDEARLDAIGVLVVVAVVGWVVYRLVRHGFERDLTVPFALAVAAVAFLAGTGYRRGNLLTTGPAQSRYAYVTVALLLPLIARAGQGLVRGSRGRRVLLAVITTALVFGQARELDHQATRIRAAKRSERGAVLATATLVRRGDVLFRAAPLSFFEPQVSVAEIVQMDHDGMLPALDQATRRDFLTVLRRLELAVAGEAVVPPATVAHVDSMRHVDATREGPGCTRLHGHADNEVVLRLDGPGTFRLRGEGFLNIGLRDPKHHVEGEGTPTILYRDADAIVSVSMGDLLVVLNLPTDAPVVLCDLVTVPPDTPERTR